LANEERIRKKDPRRYGGLYNPKLVKPTYNKQFIQDQREDQENMERSSLEIIPGPTKNYYG
jgi:hypothetical protein